ncbi:class I SAM-dependent methyltransferase [Leptolyngbya sp. CCNP1308]|uniref:class I SAM-dependent methyltransferase n=1 Tax=Leptolyngbya sp. CCNP1308 TaxID=3110255 RepID=UPI002B21BA8B|nr:class I SAM-dependent methyltransferase [Leptolyngbya sp. CCNP1308]MEA5448427.1 class I SAM-dependent methyltransferase [Leptolyngbya sp. CCNP1308]
MTKEQNRIQRWDYTSKGLSLIDLAPCFPHRCEGQAEGFPWPFLRREIPHRWYVDRRYPTVGFLSPDEAHILYNTALKFKGQSALEIGCWMGWSACHLASGGVQLDVIDPVLEKSEFYESVASSLKKAGVRDRVNLIPGYSPQQVEEIAHHKQRCWSLIFIDGNHEGTAPLEDARCCEKFAASDAIILFHDIISPAVAQGLDYFKQRGWQTKIYHTMQIMGVAWRGNVEPVIHQPDPRVAWQMPEHLHQFDHDDFIVSPDQTEWLSALAAQQLEIDYLRQTLDNLRIDVETLSALTQQDSETLSLEQLQEQLALAHGYIETIESGRLWKLRQRWVSLKQRLALPKHES